MSDRIVILDFGSQFTQLIGRRIRDMHVYCELLPWNASEAEAITPETVGIILSGDPSQFMLKTRLLSKITSSSLVAHSRHLLWYASPRPPIRRKGCQQH